MTFGAWLRALLDACARARSGGAGSPTAMRRLVGRHAYAFESLSDRESLGMLFGTLCDEEVAYHILQDQRAARNDPDRPADPERGTMRGGGVALGLRTLLRPSYFRRSSKMRARSRVVSAASEGVGFRL